MPFIKQSPEQVCFFSSVIVVGWFSEINFIRHFFLRHQIVENTKNYYNGKIEQGVTKYNDAKNVGAERVFSTANALLETTYGKYVVQKIDDSLTFTEVYLDYVLPGAEDTDDKEGVKDKKNPVQRAVSISNKVYHRLSKRAYQQMDAVQSNARSTLAQLNVTFAVVRPVIYFRLFVLG